MKRDIKSFGVTYSEWENLIDEWVFNAVHRKMLKLHLLDCVGYERIAEVFELSTRQVARIMSEEMDYLFTKIDQL